MFSQKTTLYHYPLRGFLVTSLVMGRCPLLNDKGYKHTAATAASDRQDDGLLHLTTVTAPGGCPLHSYLSNGDLFLSLFSAKGALSSREKGIRLRAGDD